MASRNSAPHTDRVRGSMLAAASAALLVFQVYLVTQFFGDEPSRTDPLLFSANLPPSLMLIWLYGRRIIDHPDLEPKSLLGWIGAIVVLGPAGQLAYWWRHLR